MRYRQGRLPTGILLISLLCCGCGGEDLPLAEVTGQVYFNGKPANAEVTFRPIQTDAETDGSVSSGLTDSEGNFELRFTIDKPGALVGSTPGDDPYYAGRGELAEHEFFRGDDSDKNHPAGTVRGPSAGTLFSLRLRHRNDSKTRSVFCRPGQAQRSPGNESLLVFLPSDSFHKCRFNLTADP